MGRDGEGRLGEGRQGDRARGEMARGDRAKGDKAGGDKAKVDKARSYNRNLDRKINFKIGFFMSCLVAVMQMFFLTE